jgi:phosphohistidine phosphatase SixA
MINRPTRRLALKTMWLSSTLPAALQLRADTDTDVAALLRSGACVLMLRHAQTEAGIGDPPHFQLSKCSTQRNLSVEGQAQSRRIARWFAAHKLVVSSVQSSAWCRCKDTATLAFGRFDLLPALNSSFDNPSTAAAQTDVLRERLKGIPAGQFEVWVTHQVNISSMTGEGPAMGEAFVIKTGVVGYPGRVLGRTRFA